MDDVAARASLVADTQPRRNPELTQQRTQGVMVVPDGPELAGLADAGVCDGHGDRLLVDVESDEPVAFT